MTKTLIKWFTPHLQIKRWIFGAFLGIMIVGGGAVAFVSEYTFVSIFGMVIIICGVILTVMCTTKMIISLITLFLPKGERDLVDILYQRRYLERGPHIVALGGGHGLSNLILGLKEYSSNITAIVTVADSGGSSGRLREEFNIVAPGDIRNCLVALADAPALMGELFQFRFSKDSQLQGHNFGNLFLTAMVQLTGDFEKAVKESSRVLAIRGRVIPSTVHNVHLVAEYEDGSFVEGEAKIPDKHVRIKRVFLKPEDVKPTAEALEAIAGADIIVLGPGSLYTSILPNLVIPDLAKAIKSAKNAFKIYICNVMTQPGETDGYRASDHVRAIFDHANRDVIDCCLVNHAAIPENALDRYRQEGSFPVEVDAENIQTLGCQVEAADLLCVSDFVRHDSLKLTRAVINVIQRNRIFRR